MSYKKRLENVQVERFAGEGRCVSRIEEKVIFIEGAIPGDIADLQIIENKKNYAVALPTHFHQRSADYVEPFCEHFGICGGCKWQHLQYHKQIEYKQQYVIETLQRIGKVEIQEVLPIIGASSQKYYRNKMEYTFTHARWLSAEEIHSQQVIDRRGLGFHIPKHFDKVLDIQTCYLQNDVANQIRNRLREFAKQRNFSFFHLKEKKGFLRGIVLRNNSVGQWLVLVQFGENHASAIEEVMQFLHQNFPMIVSLNYVINTKLNDSYADLPVITYFGDSFIVETMENFRFRVGVKSFYQTNSEQAYELYKKVREFAGLSGKEIVYDLYTGTGTIALFVSKKARKVVGIECVPEAIEDAKINAFLNQVQNAYFFVGDIKDVLKDDFIFAQGKPDVIIADPPRNGMSTEVIKKLLDIESPRLVYISCNPATQARDLQLLAKKYRVKKIQPVDMFPHTYHVENIALLEKATTI
ncbi:MAG: 23S rRNA (uracil(1939)-C(5))-methyltransferase RlmD [Cytophagales bacterium]|nr:23S rRNA (uracil(1939)-C(5))-methyltransferase RlmD [Cytophagales bacterium]MDW8383564.1 23S rRNA (uracil(1939)-C(5))-methyltransferase RlmD [Flammeovirgaceae bacterium]